MDYNDVTTIAIFSIAQLILIIVSVIWVQQLCCVIDRHNYPSLCKAIYIFTVGISTITFNIVFCAGTIFDLWTLKIGHFSIRQIFFVIAAIRLLLLLQIFKILMKQWIINHITDKTVNQRHLKKIGRAHV